MYKLSNFVIYTILHKDVLSFEMSIHYKIYQLWQTGVKFNKFIRFIS